jgi:hypothetical protein
MFFRYWENLYSSDTARIISAHFNSKIGLALTALRTRSNLFLGELVAGVEAVEIENDVQHVAIRQKEQELKVLDERLSAARDFLPPVQPTEILRFVSEKLSTLSSMLNTEALAREPNYSDR